MYEEEGLRSSYFHSLMSPRDRVQVTSDAACQMPPPLGDDRRIARSTSGALWRSLRPSASLAVTPFGSEQKIFNPFSSNFGYPSESRVNLAGVLCRMFSCGNMWGFPAMLVHVSLPFHAKIASPLWLSSAALQLQYRRLLRI